MKVIVSEKSQSEKLIDICKEIINGEKPDSIEVYNAVKVYETQEEFNNSKEFNDLWEGWQGKSMRINVMKDFPFIRAYVLADGRIFRHYKTPKGYMVIKQETIHSCLSNQGLYKALPADDSFIVLKRDCFDKTPGNFREFARLHWTLF